MKIRSITTGLQLAYPIPFRRLERYAAFTVKFKQLFKRAGYQVQTIRLTTQPWERYLQGLSRRRLVAVVRDIEKACQDRCA